MSAAQRLSFSSSQAAFPAAAIPGRATRARSRRPASRSTRRARRGRRPSSPRLGEPVQDVLAVLEQSASTSWTGSPSVASPPPSAARTPSTSRRWPTTRASSCAARNGCAGKPPGAGERQPLGRAHLRAGRARPGGRDSARDARLEFALAERVSEGRRFLDLALSARRATPRSSCGSSCLPASVTSRPKSSIPTPHGRGRTRTVACGLPQSHGRSGSRSYPRARACPIRRRGTGRRNGARRVRDARGGRRRLGGRRKQPDPCDGRRARRRRRRRRRPGGRDPSSFRRTRVRRVSRARPSARGVGRRAPR